jgi:formin-binding protein 1
MRLLQDQINVEPAPKVFLQNKLSKSQTKLKEIEPVIAGKRKHISKSIRIR